jgi:hypothetical protein
MKKIVALVILTSMCCSSLAQSTGDQIIGAWELVTIEARDEDGGWTKANGRFGNEPIGYITYSADGRMAVQICNLHRPLLDASGSAETGWVGKVNASSDNELKQALLGYTAYFGTYDIDSGDQSVTHNRAGHWIPNSVGSSVKRFYELEGNLLILTPAEFENRRLIWKRVAQ